MNTKELITKVTKTSINALINETEIIRKKYFSNKIELCSIVNAKNGKCSENCTYCAQSAHYKTNIQYYPLMNTDLILNEVEKIKEKKITHFSIVTSGPKLSKTDFYSVCTTIKEIKKNIEIKVCASLGCLNFNELSKLKDASLDRYHHNLETSRSFYPKICSTHEWSERYNVILNAQKTGLKICCGGLFGLGESWNDRLELALSIKELNIDSIPINFLTPVKGTPLENTRILTSEEALRIIALFRLILPEKTIRVCGGRLNVFKSDQHKMFQAGANAIMTGNYLTTLGVEYNSDIRLIKNMDLTL